MKETIATGKTIDEAKLNGAAELGVDADEVTVEVLEAPKSGFLGIGSKPAKLLVKYIDPEEEKKKEQRANEKKVNVKKDVKKKPAKKPKVAENLTENTVEPTKSIIDDATESDFVPNENSIPFLENYLNGLFEKTDFNVQYTIIRDGKYLRIDFSGDETGALIGKHGDTLDALQYLVQIAFNKAVKSSEKIRIDTEGYREKREKTLVSLAKSIANKVIKTKGKYELEPMKAYERKIIHATLQSYPMLTTYSVGVEPERRLIIAFKHRNNQDNK